MAGDNIVSFVNAEPSIIVLCTLVLGCVHIYEVSLHKLMDRIHINYVG